MRAICFWSCLRAATCLAVLSCGTSSSGPGGSKQELLLKSLNTSSACTFDVQIREAGYNVLTDQAAYQRELEGSFQSPPAASSVDFDSSVVLVAHLGERPNCGSSVSISSVREMDDFVEVTVHTSTGLGCPADDLSSYPVVFAEAKKSPKPYKFTETTTDDCLASTSR